MGVVSLVILAIVGVVLALVWKKHGHLVDYFYVFVRSKYRVHQFLRSDWTVADLFEDRVNKYPTKTALVYVDGKQIYTYKQLDREANKLAAWAWSEGLRPKQVVALMMENKPEFIITWLGLSKIGVTTSLINTNLKGASLQHAINVCEAQVIIAGPECTSVVDELKTELKTSKLWVFGSPNSVTGWGNLTQHLHSAKDAVVQPSQRAGVGSSDLLFYIYTSGTTGLPKAAKIKHVRFALAGQSFSGFNHLTCDDRIYTPLPLYHSAACMIGVGSAWTVGGAVVLRSKFSASNFFKDCYEHNVTVIQYIGQICRYLVNTPTSEYDRAHMIQKALGNGMQMEVWEQFQKRFNVPYIGEFYASTEGNANLLNNQNKTGACGYVPPIAELVYPVAIVAYDHDHEQPKRNNKGRCIVVKDGEAGELIALVVNTDPIRQFDGYTVQKANDDKMLRNVFKDGDCWFRTGDLLRRDAEGYVFFVDRIGDTFRWKGENVATSEVSAVMSEFPNVFAEINVYGVSVPHNEGRAGMASVTLQSGLIPSSTPQFNDTRYDSIPIDWKALYQFLSTHLPSYQQPLFVRVQPEQEITTTFKHKKADLVKEGFNPNTIADPIFFRDDKVKSFVPLTTDVYQQLQEGNVRV